MDIASVPGLSQPAQSVAPQTAPVAGPAAPAAPIEPARRVTANRDGGRGDLATQHQQPQRSPTASRGRLIDMFV